MYPSTGESVPAAGQGLDSTVLHVDMDAFFVSVELLDAPGLRGIPVIVGSESNRSVVLSASYEARDYGVRSAMPMATARRLCPQAVIVEPHQDKYRQASTRVMAIFSEITDLVEPLSVDEAFIDVRGATRRLGSPRDIGEMIRRRVAAELGMTASVGIASSKFVAKIASTRAKPDGLLVIPRNETVAYLHSLPVSALWGVGAKTQQSLSRLGISTIADVASTPVGALRRALGSAGEHVHRLSWGVDERAVTPIREEKSIGAEETFGDDVASDEALRAELLRLAHRTASRLRSAGVKCRTVSIKIRYSDFSTLTRSKTLVEPVDSAHLMYSAAASLLTALGNRPMSVRLIGLRAESLENSADSMDQLTIDGRDDNWRAAEEALDRINSKYGQDNLQPARLLSRDRPGRAGPAGPGSAGLSGGEGHEGPRDSDE
ncbi:DNA polymerase IV [Arthrobacter castelli]|uniref:DNA polymerase IV n=1 Tax=Arthrobacter castelli TaxID=271431 RepID=UPI00042295E8|nr:DNA polymerase IV [Arthrobacter castelli]